MVIAHRALTGVQNELSEGLPEPAAHRNNKHFISLVLGKQGRAMKKGRTPKRLCL